MPRASTPREGGPPFPLRALPFAWHYLLRRPWHFGTLLVLIIGAAGCSIAVQYGLRLLVDAMATAQGDRSGAWPPFALFVGLIVSESVLWRSAGWLSVRSIVATGIDIRLDLFQYLSGHSMRYFADRFAGSLGNRITGAAGGFDRMVAALSWNILPPCADFVGALMLFMLVDWRMAAALLLFVTALVAGLARYGTHGHRLHQTYAEQGHIVNGELVDTLANIWLVKAFSARSRERQRLAQKFGHESTSHLRSWLYVEKTRVMHDAALCTASGGMLGWAIYLWTEGRITPGEVVMVSTLTFRILHGSRDLALALISTAQHAANISETLGAIGHPHLVADTADACPLAVRGAAVEFREVSYAYANGRNVFQRLSLRIQPGQKLGLVGASGAGKTTLISLLQRLDDVQQGQILIDGQPLAAVTQDSLRAAIAVVPQEVSMFHRSILENIRYGRPDASDEEVMAAARAACCENFIIAMPQGFDTLVGERGTKLSGGQRQRLGIARALLKDAPILILDEATSALDSESEAAIQRALAVLMRGRTVLAVAHRLSTLSSLDRVIVLDEGRIIEDGSPGELRRAGGVFASLWRMQAEGFEHDRTTADAA